MRIATKTQTTAALAIFAEIAAKYSVPRHVFNNKRKDHRVFKLWRLPVNQANGIARRLRNLGVECAVINSTHYVYDHGTVIMSVTFHAPLSFKRKVVRKNQLWG